MITWKKINDNDYRVSLDTESWELYRISKGNNWWLGTRNHESSRQLKVKKTDSALTAATQEIINYYKSKIEKAQKTLDEILTL